MNFKNIFSNFIWKDESNYDFSLSQSDKRNNSSYISDEELNLDKEIYTNISSNLDYIKMKYNSMINSDIIIREFTLKAKYKNFKAFIIFIDGMVDTNLINNFVLKPLMLKDTNDDGFSIVSTNNVVIRKVKKINIQEYVINSLIPQNSVKKQTLFSEIISGINSGNCALFIDTFPFALDIDVKGFKQRSISTPNNEVIIKGPQEAFVESLRTNTSMLRRTINNENLIIENINVGKLTKTKCAICYMKNIANDDLVAEAKYRINNLKIDTLLASRTIRTVNFY